MPRIERAAPPYVQITDHYRKRIIDGTLSEGEKLDGVHKIAKDWGVSAATAAKAIGQLGVEGLVVTSPRGSFVAALNAKANSPADRVTRSRKTGSTDAAGEHHRVLSAAIVPAPTYVAELFDIEPSSQVVRREWVTVEKTQPRSLTVTWHTAETADAVPDLLTSESSKVGPMLAHIEDEVGKVNNARDYFHARGCDSREANYLGLPVGAAVLGVTWLYWTTEDDGHRLLEYGECVLPARHTVSYPYDVEE